MLSSLRVWAKKNELRLWLLGVCLIGFAAVCSYVIFLRPLFCSPQISEKWTEHHYEYSYPQYYGTEQRGYAVTEKKKPSYGSDGKPHSKQAESALEVICGETKFTDLAIAYLTFCLVAVGWFTMRSADENTKNSERAFLVAGPLFGVPHDGIDPWPMKHRSYADMFHGPYRMAIHNFGKTAGYTTKVEWGLCPEEEIKRFLVKGVRISDLFRKRGYWEFQKKWIKGQTYIQDIIGPTGNTPHHYRHVSIPERRDYIDWVFFGMITYKDVFRDEHDSTFSYRIVPQHSDSIGESLSDDHT